MFQLILGRHGRQSSSRSIGFANRRRPDDRGLVTYAGDGHVITFAPTGTGKTTGPVICNALMHPGQLIVLDIKGEVHAATAAKRRAMGQEVHVLDLRDDPEPGALNPLDLAARCGTDYAVVGRSLAAAMIERGGNENDRFWNDWAETMIAGGIAWLLADRPPDERTLGRLFDLYIADNSTFSMACALDKKEVQDRSAKAAFTSYLQLPEDNTRPSVMGTTQTHLRLFDSDLVRRLTDTTSFDLDALIAGRPMSLYVIVPPFRLEAYRPLLRLWLSGLMLALTQRKTVPPIRTLMLCDEIGNIGRVEAFLMAASLMRSWGLTLWTFWQNPAQLQLYGNQANTLVDNAGVVQIFGARNRRMAQELSSLIGNVDPDTILNLPRDEQLLLIEGQLVRCKQTRYYEDGEFGGLSGTIAR